MHIAGKADPGDTVQPNTPTATVVRYKDNPDGTTTNYLSDGTTSTVKYTQNADGSLTPTEVLGDIPQVLPTHPRTSKEQYDAKGQKLRDLDKDANPVKRTSRWKSALQAGLLDLSHAFGGRQIRTREDFLAAAAEAATYMAGGAINPKLGPDMKRDRDIAEARGELGDAEAAYQSDEKMRKGEADIKYQDMRPEFEQTKAELRRKTLEAKVLKDENDFNFKIEKERKKAEAAGNKYRIDVDEETGQVIRYFPNDPGKTPEKMTLPDGSPWIKPSSQVYDYLSPSGTAVKVKGSDVLRTDVGLATANTNTVNAADKYNTDQQNEYQQRVTAYENSKAELSAKSVAAVNLAGETQTQLDGLAEQIRQQGYPATAQQQSEMSRMREDIRTKKVQAEQFDSEAKTLRPPPKPAAYTPRTVSSGKYAGRVFGSPAELRQYFPGKSDDEIRRKVEANGGQFGK